LEITLRSESAEHTARFGRTLATLLRPGDVLPLWGEFGAGKTTFVQGVGLGLGVERPILSPSFGLIHAHPAAGGRTPLYHLDLYRIGTPEEAEAFGVEEVLRGDGAVLIEWPGAVESLLPRDRLDVRFEVGQGDERVLRFEARGERATALLRDVADEVGQR
jgi:tRNA threonylcarbamoyladenosine biosynthesis protein TsaE